MTTQTNSISAGRWTEREKLIFRFFFLFFILQALPLSIDFFKIVFGFDWLYISYGNIFDLTRLSAKFIPGSDSLLNWLIVAVISLSGTAFWSRSKYKDANYNELYYWLRVVVRYRLAIGIIGYGFIKFFPMQAPFPSISNLNTSYGDFTNWKLFSMSLGIVPGYETFLGSVEILAGLLLFFRKTATVGAIIILVFTGNVFISNLAYNGGEYVYALYLISFAVFVLWFDAIRIYNLIALERPTQPNVFKPYFNSNIKPIRKAVKGFIIFFFIFFYGFKTYSGSHRNPYQFPKTKGLARAAGIYNVTEFKINNKVLPYNPADPVRWKDVVFEKWATISIRSNRPVLIDSLNDERIFTHDKERNYELAGSGGRHYYAYQLDTINHLLLLENKNFHYKDEQLTFKYSRPDTATIILKGVNEKRDSLHVVLNRIEKKYPLKMSRRKALKL
jgi:hypothetical protein